MSVLVVQPHHDDAIWSIGEHLTTMPNTILATYAGGEPPDPTDPGHQKWERLAKEHDAASALLSLEHEAMPYLDDVYPWPPAPQDLEAAFLDLYARHVPSELWLPVGIHHPDHLRVTTAAMAAWYVSIPRRPLVLWEELPYRVLYPEHAIQRLAEVAREHNLELEPGGRTLALRAKRALVRCYASQLEGDEPERCLYVPERIWRARCAA